MPQCATPTPCRSKRTTSAALSSASGRAGTKPTGRRPAVTSRISAPVARCPHSVSVRCAGSSSSAES